MKFLCDDPYWSLFSTYVLGDGDLARDSKVRFYDNEKATLVAIRDFFSKRFGYVFPAPIYERNQFQRGQWVIRTRHSSIHFVLTEYYGIEVGRKKPTSIFPKRILESRNPEVKKAAIAGLISSDGYISSHKFAGKFSVTVGVLSTVSRVKANMASRLLHDLGYPNSVFDSTYPNPFSGKPVTQIGVVVHAHSEVVRLLFDTMPYLVKPSRVRRWLSILAQRDFYRRVRMRSTKSPQLLREASKKISGHGRRYLDVLIEIAARYGIQVEKSGAKHWTESSRLTAVPLPIVVESCKILGENTLDHVPPGLAPLLWLQNELDYVSLVQLRSAKPILNLEELIEDSRETKSTTTLRASIREPEFQRMTSLNDDASTHLSVSQP